MSKDWCHDIAMMHEHYGVNKVVDKMDPETLRKFLDFRVKFLQEELDELNNADNPEDIVDALIDLCVVAIGTLDSFDVNPYVAWDAVLKANMAKKIGVKESRPNPLGLPDLIKPEGWVAPEHKDNIGLVSKLFKD